MKHQWIQLCLAACAWLFLSSPAAGVESLRSELDTLVPETQSGVTFEIDWRVVAERIEGLAASTEIEAAQGVYLDFLIRMDGGLAWLGNNQVSGFFRSWLEDALLFSESPSALAKVHYWLARHLHHADDRLTQIERIGRLYEFAVELDSLPQDMAWDALFYRASWARDFGIQSFDSRGEVFYEGDFAFALEMYQRLLDQYSAPSDEARNRVEAEIAAIVAPELAWVRPNSFFPESEVQLRVRSRNLNQVHIELHPVSSLGAFRVDGKGRLVVSDDQQRTETIHQSVFSPQPRRPHFSDERLVTLPVLAPGAYQLRARSGGLEHSEWLTVTDFAIIVQRDRDRLQILAVQSESGQSLEGVDLRIWLESSTGEWSDFGASIDQRGVTSFSIPEEYREGRFQLVGKWQDRISIVRGKAYDGGATAAVTPPSWSVLPDLVKSRPGQTFGWRAIPTGMETGWLDKLDRDHGVVAIWQSRDGSFSKELDVQISSRGVLRGELTSEMNWPRGLYRVAFRGRFEDSRVWQTEPLAGFYLSSGVQSRIRSEIVLDRRGDGLVSSVTAQDGIRGSVRLRTTEGAAVPGSSVRLTLRNSQNEPSIYRSDPIQTNAEGDATFAIVYPALADASGLLWLEVELVGESRETPWGKWVFIQDQPFSAMLELTERIYRIGDQIQVKLELSSDSSIPSSIPGTLIVHRERWQSVYVHRRRGNEITGEQFRELPERSLLGTSQGDFRLRDEGFVTEEVRRLDVRVEDGQALFTLPVGEPGFYRMSWIAPGQAGRSVQADARFWVVGDAQRHMNYRPGNLEIIFSQDVLSSNRSNRMLVASPHLNTHVLLTEGSGERKQQRLLDLPNRTSLLNLDLARDQGLITFMELNAVIQGQWLRERRAMPVARGDGSLRLHVDRLPGLLRPGDDVSVELKATDGQGRPVEVELHTFIRPVHELDIVERMRRLGANRPGLRNTPWQTTSSIEIYPYPGSVLNEGLDQDESHWCEVTERRLIAEMHNMSFLTAATGRALPVEVLERVDEAAVLSWPLPETGGDWVLEWIAVDAEGRVASHREWISTRDVLLVNLELPAFARVGDSVNIRLRAQNDSDEDVSGDVDVTVWLNDEALIDETRSFRLESNSFLNESFTVHPEKPGRLKIRVETDREDEVTQLERELDILPSSENAVGFLAKAITLPTARQLPFSAEDASLTADPWVLLGAAAQHSDSLGSDSVDELAMRLLFSGRILSMEILPSDDQIRLKARAEELIDRIGNAQNSDGGWSWVGRTGSDPWTTALVLFSLVESTPADAERWLPIMLRGRQYLLARLMQDTMNPRMLAWVLHANAHFQNRFGPGRPERLEARGFIQLMRDWDQLDRDVQAMLLLVAYQFRFEEEIRVLSEALSASAVSGNNQWQAVESDGWRYPGLQRLLWFRGLLWSNTEMRHLVPLEPDLISSLFPGRDPVATARFAQALFAEYLILKDHQGRLLDSAYSHPVMDPWSQEALDSVVADPYIYVLSRTAPSSDKSLSADWGFQRSGELRRLTPTLLRGLVEQVQPWTDTESVVQGARLHLKWEWNLDRPLQRVRIDLPLPAGWIALPDSNQNLLRIMPDDLTVHRGYSSDDHQVTLFIPEIPAGSFALSLQLQAQTPGRFQIFSPKWTLHDSSRPKSFEEPVIVEILPSDF